MTQTYDEAKKSAERTIAEAVGLGYAFQQTKDRPDSWYFRVGAEHPYIDTLAVHLEKQWDEGYRLEVRDDIGASKFARLRTDSLDKLVARIKKFVIEANAQAQRRAKRETESESLKALGNAELREYPTRNGYAHLAVDLPLSSKEYFRVGKNDSGFFVQVQVQGLTAAQVKLLADFAIPGARKVGQGVR